VPGLGRLRAGANPPRNRYDGSWSGDLVSFMVRENCVEFISVLTGTEAEAEGRVKVGNWVGKATKEPLTPDGTFRLDLPDLGTFEGKMVSDSQAEGFWSHDGAQDRWRATKERPTPERRKVRGALGQEYSELWATHQHPAMDAPVWLTELWVEDGAVTRVELGFWGQRPEQRASQCRGLTQYGGDLGPEGRKGYFLTVDDSPVATKTDGSFQMKIAHAGPNAESVKVAGTFTSPTEAHGTVEMGGQTIEWTVQRTRYELPHTGP